jgi:hypothetical protein
MKVKNNLVSFYIFGYLLELRIKFGEFFFFFELGFFLEIWWLKNSKKN